ncbi:hypothetical protein ABL78_7921 [Leptomonas seymouri]|uniref:Uncharacterized protein n=1 Tax=Leptomonas seymouri TaxID=5684 RepID=A0A0N1IHH7_LEPSE|nr:hypothetical protein ABL78_7921 [Leptomonas seymouri]|eukprot:KPI83055.1 hypothetical protein ABL78_7921 [Leptomonas seymouri]
METKGKSGWGLPVILAVGVITLYCTTLKLSAILNQRRRAILQRLQDGTLPCALLEEGYTRVELLGAGVPLVALSSRSSSPATSEGGNSRSASHSEAARSGRSEHLDTPEGGVFTWLYDMLLSVSDSPQTASGTIVEDSRRRSPSMNSVDVKATRTRGATAHTAPSCASHTVAASSGGPRSSSICLASALLRSSHRSTESTESVLPERNRSQTPGGAHKVHVVALSAAVTRSYTEESCIFQYPLEVLRFLHEDGSRLSIMAEDCAAVESDGDGVFTTETYVQRSLARARAAADASKTYFKVKLSTAARNIATTVMESYVNIHVGPSPVTLACFYLVSRGMAYTIQLQTHTGAYEERLSDLLYTAQSARVHGCSNPPTRGHNVFKMQVEGVESLYLLDVPVGLVVRAADKSSNCRSTLTLKPRNASGSNVSCCVKAEIRPANFLSTASQLGVRTLLRDAHVLITLYFNYVEQASTNFSELLKMVSARRASAADAAAPVDTYVSPSLTLPLPSPRQFLSVVCEHTHDPFVSLYIRAAATAPHVADVFEMELRCMHGLDRSGLDTFAAYLKTLFLAPSELKRMVNGAGQEGFVIEGLAAALTETSMRVFGVQVCDDIWLVVRWLYADSAVFPHELKQYCRALTDAVSAK